MKKCILMTLLFFAVLSVFSYEFSVFDSFSLEVPENIEIKLNNGASSINQPITPRTFIDPNTQERIHTKYFVQQWYYGIYKGINFNMHIYLRTRNEIELDKLKEHTGILKVVQKNGQLGMGGEYESVRTKGRLIDTGFMSMRCYAGPWGSDFSRDLLAYSFDLNHPIFSECVINFYNIDYTESIPYTDISIETVEELISEDGAGADLYTAVFSMMESLISYW